jgi:nitrile hydratase
MSSLLTPIHIPTNRNSCVPASGTSRWFVIPERPAGTEEFTVEMLMDLVTTESMMGVALAGPAT